MITQILIFERHKIIEVSLVFNDFLQILIQSKNQRTKIVRSIQKGMMINCLLKKNVLIMADTIIYKIKSQSVNGQNSHNNLSSNVALSQKQVDVVVPKVEQSQTFIECENSIIKFLEVKSILQIIFIKLSRPTIILMSQEKYIAQTLELPSQIPLFRYNVNFQGVKKLIEDSNIKINSNEQQINTLKQKVQTKYQTEQFKAFQKFINNSLKLGVNVKKFIQNQQKQGSKLDNIKVREEDNKGNVQQFSWKLGKLNEIIDNLLIRVEQSQQKIGNDDKKHEKLINQSFRRLEERLDSSLQSFTKTINNYFSESNKKVASLDSQQNIVHLTIQTKIKDMQGQLNSKIGEDMLKSTLQGYKHQIVKDLESQIENDQNKRLAAIEQMNNNIKQYEKNQELQNKSVKQKVQELDEKVAKALSTKLFDMQKHKIYEKLSEFKNKSDDLAKKNNQFVQFRKAYLLANQKTKQELIGIQDELKKLKQSGSSFKKMQNIGELLEKLDPHLICQINNQVKLHQKQIGRLQKKLMFLQNQDQKNKKNQVSMPQVNNGQNSDMIQKIIKQYMGNMDFQGRTKKVERDLQEVSRRSDVFHELQKKIYVLSKEMDMGAINKQLKRKCDEESIKRQTKILDGKIEQLFEFFKGLRKQLQHYSKNSSKPTKDPIDNFSLTTKKLYSLNNCISCQPSAKKERRAYSRQKLDLSLDQGSQFIKSTIYSKMK